MSKSLCKGKRVIPNKCKKLRGCKVARGTKRTYCRKAKNKTSKRGGAKRCPPGSRRNKAGKCIKNQTVSKSKKKKEGRYQYNKKDKYAIDDFNPDEHGSSKDDWSSNPGSSPNSESM